MSVILFSNDEIFRFSNVKCCGSVMHSHHYHDLFEIYYMASGKCHYFIDDKSYEVLEGDVVLIPEGVIHKTNYGGEEHARILIECSRHFIPDSVREKLKSMVHLYRNSSVTRDIYLILKKIEEEQKNPDEFTSESLRSLMSILFFSLVRNKNTIGIGESKNQMIENIVGYIKANYANDISLSAVAKANFVSAEHLSRTFKKETGFGFNEFLTLVRLQRAEVMLKDRKSKSISEIAYSCGFNDSNYFSDKFKKAYGISPLKFSKEHQ